MTTSTRTTALEDLVSGLRGAVDGSEAPAAAVADVLVRLSPDPGLLTENQCRGTSKRYANVLLHAEAAFSVSALVWRPGQGTVIHDHLTWCVAAVISGTEHEIRYVLRAGRAAPVDELDNEVGSISCLTPPGDIHRIVNTSDVTAISLHVYGVDLREAASSVRRTYRPV